MSKRKNRRRYMLGRQGTLVSALALLVTLNFQAHAMAAEPAVSGLNGKAEGAFGSNDGDGFGYGAASIAAPLGDRFGVQADVLAGSHDGYFIGSGGLHAFWRDPSVGLAGLYVSRTEYDRYGGRHQNKYGVEGELYLDRVTLSGVGGYTTGDVTSDGFSNLNASYYASDDFRLTIGHRFANETHVGAAGVENQFYSSDGLGAAVFAEGRLAEGGDAAAWAGVRLYFGADKSLMRRHREDDPQIFLTDDLFELTSNVPTPPSAGNNEF